MASTSRATLPEEFFDITSSMLLVQPEPQYLYAALWKATLGAQLNMSGPLGVQIPDRQFGQNGASYTPVERDRLMMSDPILGAVWRVVPELGKGPGHTVRLNRPSYANTTYTQASREVAGGSTISTTGITVSSEQTSLTLKRFAGPYSSAASAVAPFAIERFDASVSLHSMAEIHGTSIKRDFDRTIDAFSVALLDSAGTVIRPKGFSADTDFATTDSGPMDFSVISRTERSMDDANIPVFPDGKRMMVLRPAQCQQLADDAQFAKYVDANKEINPVLAPGYWKTIGNFHIFKNNTLTSDTTTVSGVTINRGHAFGPGVLGSGVGRLPEVVFHTNDNYGETALVIWLTYSAFSLLDNRFVRSIRTSSD